MLRWAAAFAFVLSSLAVALPPRTTSVLSPVVYPQFRPTARHVVPALNMDAVGLGLFVGDQHAAGALPQLRALNITAILNVAWDLDIRYALDDYVGNVSDFDERLEVEFAKVGLVDGGGNRVATLASAVLYLHQLRTQNASTFLPKDRETFPPVRNILVHCHSGQSRSVTVAALYLFYRGAYGSYADALAHVKACRHVGGLPVPQRELTATANALVKRFPDLLNEV